MADSCDFGKLLNTSCDKLLYAQQTGRKNIKELDDNLQYSLLWRTRLLEEKDVFTIYLWHEQFFGKVFEIKADKCCTILKFHCNNSKAHRAINLEMAKILREKGFNNVLPGQKLCSQCVIEYEKLTKPPKNENMTEIIETESSQDELAPDDDFLLYGSPKKKLNSTLENIGVFPVNIHGVAQHSDAPNTKGKLKKFLNVCKENISAAYNVSDIEIEELFDRDTKNKVEELDRLHSAMTEKLITASNTEKLQILTLVPHSWSRKYCSECFGVSQYLI